MANDFVDQVRESRRKLESDLRRALRDVTLSASRALDAAIATRDQGERAVADELARLEALRGRLTTIASTR